MEILKKIDLSNKTIKIIHGDITLDTTDAIVNAANSHLKHGGGVALAIVRRGGSIIQQESDKIGYVPTGSAAITTGGKLNAKYVIHAVGPIWGEGDEENKLRSAVKSALQIAEDNKLNSISMPAISSGIFGFPKDKAAHIIFKTAVDFLKNSHYIKEIHFCNIDILTCELFIKESESIEV
jgi:O-acetyl-ADP-ribose deacetylase (regulator of RNase III)